MTLFGPDISNENFGGPDGTDLEAAAAFVNAVPGQGFSWLEMKCSQGSDFIDPYYSTVFQACVANGLPMAPYHFVDTTDPAAQAQNCLNALGGNTSLGLMLDFEEGAGDIDNFWAVVAAMNSVGLNVALSYIPNFYWQDIGEPDISTVPGLISAAYPTTAEGFASSLYASDGGADGEGWTPYGGATPQIWQFTDAALIAGLSVDCNAFEGTLDELLVLIGAGPDPNWQLLSNALNGIS
jgi:lysozyme